MNEIKLFVEDKNLETVLSILNNLKTDLIKTIDVNAKANREKRTQYQPKTSTVIREENSGTNDTSGKYINKATYKQRLKKK